MVEETGLPDGSFENASGAAFDLDIHPIPQNAIEPGHLHFDLRFLFRARSTMLGRADDPHGVRWVGLDEAIELNPEPAMTRIQRKLAAQPTLDS